MKDHRHETFYETLLSIPCFIPIILPGSFMIHWASVLSLNSAVTVYFLIVML